MTDELAATLPRHPTEGQPLTDRQAQVVRLVAAGLTNEEIGARMFVSTDTVRTFLRRISHKLGARNRAHIVHLAHRAGELS